MLYQELDYFQAEWTTSIRLMTAMPGLNSGYGHAEDWQSQRSRASATLGL